MAKSESDTIPVQGNQTEVTTQTTSVQKEESQGFLGSVANFLPMVVIFVVFYFFVLRPQEKKRKNQETLIGSVKKGEEVVTHSGIYGTVVKVSSDSNIVELEISKDVVIKVLKQSISDIASRKKVESTKAIENKKDK